MRERDKQGNGLKIRFRTNEPSPGPHESGWRISASELSDSQGRTTGLAAADRDPERQSAAVGNESIAFDRL
jgi:hypothetical protein